MVDVQPLLVRHTHAEKDIKVVDEALPLDATGRVAVVDVAILVKEGVSVDVVQAGQWLEDFPQLLVSKEGREVRGNDQPVDDSLRGEAVEGDSDSSPASVGTLHMVYIMRKVRIGTIYGMSMR